MGVTGQAAELLQGQASMATARRQPPLPGKPTIARRPKLTPSPNSAIPPAAPSATAVTTTAPELPTSRARSTALSHPRPRSSPGALLGADGMAMGAESPSIPPRRRRDKGDSPDKSNPAADLLELRGEGSSGTATKAPPPARPPRPSVDNGEPEKASLGDVDDCSGESGVRSKKQPPPRPKAPLS